MKDQLLKSNDELQKRKEALIAERDKLTDTITGLREKANELRYEIMQIDTQMNNNLRAVLDSRSST